MGFNARLAPFTIATTVEVRATSKDAAASQHYPVFRFPFAGQLVGAYANVRKVTLAGTAMDAAVEATTATGVQEISLWKHATDDTTATYATALRAALRTGNKDTSTGGGINWRLPTTSGVNGLYALTNKSAARRKFGAGDVMLMHIAPYGVTDAHRAYNIELQADYIIGYEAS